MPPHYNLCQIITNSFQKGRQRIKVPASRQNLEICKILYEEGFLTSIQKGDLRGPYPATTSPSHPQSETVRTPFTKSPPKLWLDLKYRHGEPVLKEMKTISKPSERVFASVDELKAVAAARNVSKQLRGRELGQVTVVDTVFGILELKEALRKNVGGEVLCHAR
ncbi:hypothetical protein HK097_001721 [Rhizophlyctis rosea]|uniref:Ribosomal protein S8 n=1 Tax=Rhizophlyctis rosea TaxID=64517 RepID=A0AAD5SHH8_9FUNG|nr:hypothetical protein HK097_001721 [Rhizophlyctis rosea]